MLQSALDRQHSRGLNLFSGKSLSAYGPPPPEPQRAPSKVARGSSSLQRRCAMAACPNAPGRRVHFALLDQPSHTSALFCVSASAPKSIGSTGAARMCARGPLHLLARRTVSTQTMRAQQKPGYKPVWRPGKAGSHRGRSQGRAAKPSPGCRAQRRHAHVTKTCAQPPSHTPAVPRAQEKVKLHSG